MQRPLPVAARKIHLNGSSYRATVPSEIVDRFSLEDGDSLLWECGDDGTITIYPPDRD